MSISELRTVKCPNCLGSNKIVFYSSVSPSSDKSLRDSILNDTLFKYTCIHCGYEAQLSYPVIYNDIKRCFMIYYLPRCKKRVITDRIIERDSSQTTPIKKRLVPSYNDLKEKIVIFESNLDDMAVEITKLALKIKTEKDLKIKIDCGYFSFCDKQKIGFTFFDAATKKPTPETTDIQVYQKSLDIATHLGRRQRNSKAFIKIDNKSARYILKLYKRHGLAT